MSDNNGSAVKICLDRLAQHEKMTKVLLESSHEKIVNLEQKIERIERVLLISVAAIISSMGYIILTLMEKI